MEIFAVEIFATSVKIEYANGSSEEVEGGIYERKNSNEDTVEERLASAADIARLRGLAADFEAGLPEITADVVGVERLGDNLQIKFADGTKEEIENGVYERKDSDNETIVERPATQADRTRLEELATEVVGNSPDDDGTADQGPGDNDGSGDGSDVGSSGNDSINTGAGDDSVEGKDGDDSIATGAGEDTLMGGDGDDRMRAGDENDLMIGGGGDDRMRGNSGDDTMKGGSGDDRMRGNNGDDKMKGGDGDDRLRGDTGNDTVLGGDGNDRVRGGGGDDVVKGNAGDDRVIGNRGDDTLNGGNGADIYIGGAGADTFVFKADGEEDIIKDFQSGVDVIDLRSYGFASASDVLGSAFEDGGDTYIDLGSGDVIKLDDVSLSQISESDFLI